MRIRWREFELPNRVTRDESVSTPTYGMFVAEPFERGFAHTVGNGLRRVLLSSLEGAALTHLRIQGVPHEFSTIDGVVEDMTELVLNVKKILVRTTASEPRTIRLEARKKGPVTAAAFKETHDVEIANRDLYLCTLSKEVDFQLEAVVRRGRGYVTAEENYDPESELGLIPIDSVFSPVQRVRYSAQATRVGKMTNYDKLVLEVWTNGTVAPEMAILEAAKIYRRHLDPFVMPGETGGATPVGIFSGIGGGADAGTADAKEVLLRPISSLDLSVRAANCMREEGIETVGQLVRKSHDELLLLKNFGKTTLREVEKKLEETGLTIGMDVDAILGS